MLRRYPTPRAHYLALQRNLSVARNGFDRMRFCDCRRPLRGSDQRRIDSVLARATPRGHGSANMPSLSRFIILFAFVSAFGYGIMVVLANWPQPVRQQKPRAHRLGAIVQRLRVPQLGAGLFAVEAGR